MKMFKYQASGNDFLIVENERITPSFVRRVCSRKLGVGADGVLDLDSKNMILKIYNSDGSEALFCGNAMRCLGVYFHKNEKKLKKLIYKSGSAILDDKSYPNIVITLPRYVNEDIDFQSDEVVLHNNLYTRYFIDVGNKHIVILDSEISKLDMIKLAAKSYKEEYFNLNTVRVINKNKIKVSTYEIGAGFTSSCASGALACVKLLNHLGFVDKKVKVENDNGDFFIEIGEVNKIIGDAKYIATIEVD